MIETRLSLPTAWPRPILRSMSQGQAATILPGDARHPEHDAFLLELGRSTYQLARVAGACFDILRVLGDHEADELYGDTLGRTVRRLRELADKRPELTDLRALQESLANCLETRNDLQHALPVAGGLQRRRPTDPHFVKDYFTVEALAATTAAFRDVHVALTNVLYRDDGAAVKAWTTRPRA